MKCSKCSTEAVKNQVLNKEFWYCRTCKEEVNEKFNYSTFYRDNPLSFDDFDDEPEPLSLTQDELDALLKGIP